MRQHGVASHPLGPHHKAAAAVQGATHHLVARRLGDRHGFASEHRFIDRAAPVLNDAIHRHFLPRPHPQAVADVDHIQGNIRLTAIGGDAPGLARGKVQERADRPAGALPRPQFQNLAEEHQDDDHGGRLEINGDRAAWPAKGRRKDAGSERRRHAIDPRHADAQRNQREHVEAAADQRSPAADKERPACPYHHRRRQEHLEKIGAGRR